MSDGGKGSAKRPTQVSKETFSRNWDAIFGKKAPTPEPTDTVWFDSVDKPTKEVGDIVSPKPGHDPLASGASRYGAAVVISVEPYVMVSEHADMRWGAQDPQNYVVKGKAGTELLARCMTRL